MAGHIKEKFGWNVEVPQYGEKIELVFGKVHRTLVFVLVDAREN